MPVAIGYLVWWALTGGGLSAAWDRPGEGGLSIWQGVDIVVGVTVSWVPLAADYTRFARTQRGAFWGTGIGYLLPDALLLALGAVILLTRDVGDAAALPAAVAAGGIVALVALCVLTVAETDEAFANAYSGAVSLQNLFPRAPQRLLIVATTTVGTVGALALELTSFQSFLFLLGSFFVPLFAVLLADWLLAGRSYDADDVFGAPAWRPGLIAAWIVGFGTYQYLSPTGPDLVDRAGAAAGSAGLGDRRHAAELRRVLRGRPGRCSRVTATRTTTRVEHLASPHATRGNRREPRARRRRTARRSVPAARSGTAPARSARSTPMPTSCSSAARAGRSRGSRSGLEEFGFPVVLAARRADDTVFVPLRGRAADHADRRARRPVDAGRHRGWVGEAIGDAPWVLVGALTRGDFPLATLAALTARGHRLIVDAQGLVRQRRVGPLVSDGRSTVPCSGTSRR